MTVNLVYKTLKDTEHNLIDVKQDIKEVVEDVKGFRDHP